MRWENRTMKMLSGFLMQMIDSWRSLLLKTVNPLPNRFVNPPSGASFRNYGTLLLGGSMDAECPHLIPDENWNCEDCGAAIPMPTDLPEPKLDGKSLIA